ncbi:Alpha/beta hydrolase family protein [Stieleria neptunia]|uniref:Alpha/beta hydrolase family protein n=2 Tax=Stieleria neptunia TaxID=2527979 RepID=A0A518HYZ8_9BACT|nr:Alpha/beta hydrolase family protein [Stieleria neptunia]
MIATSCSIMAGLIASWFVAGALVAPSPRVIGDPPRELNATSFTVNSESGSVVSGWQTQPHSGNGVIVLLHGIHGSRLSMLERARMLHDAGYATVMIDFQAHGESPGDTITIGYLEQHDVRAAVEFARREHPGEPIGVIGVSLGGAAALLASPLQIDALVLESVYPNIHDAIHNRVAAKLGPLASIPASMLLLQFQPRLGFSPQELRPIDHLPGVGCPVCVASGSEDRHTTASETQAMFSAAPEPKRLWLVDGAEHVDLFRKDPIQYRERIVGFFDEYLRGDREAPASPGVFGKR